MPRWLTIITLATLAFAVAATSAADTSTGSTSKSKTKKPASTAAKSKPKNSLTAGSPLKNKPYKPNAKIPPLADFSKGKRPTGQELAKELKERLKKTGSLSGTHHPAVEAALKTAKAQNKQLLLLFVTSTCPVCRKMQHEALDAKEFKEHYLKDFVVFTVDCDKKPEIVEHYLFEPKVPHYKILDAKGQIVKEKTGYDTDQQFADWLAEK